MHVTSIGASGVPGRLFLVGHAKPVNFEPHVALKPGRGDGESRARWLFSHETVRVRHARCLKRMPRRVGENLPNQGFDGCRSQTGFRHFDGAGGGDQDRSLARVQNRGIAVHFDQSQKEKTDAPGCDTFLRPSIAIRSVLASDQVERHAQLVLRQRPYQARVAFFAGIQPWSSRLVDSFRAPGSFRRSPFRSRGKCPQLRSVTANGILLSFTEAGSSAILGTITSVVSRRDPGSREGWTSTLLKGRTHV